MDVTMFLPAELATIGRAMQLALTPVFLLAGLGAMLNVMAGRLGRVIDRARERERQLAAATGADRAPLLKALGVLDRRMALVLWAITCCIASAVTVCLVVATLFVSEAFGLHTGPAVAVLFVAAMAFITVGLMMFLAETRIALRSVRVAAQLLTETEA